nr:hypothetical protein [Klebsiella quasipneumoniae]
MTSKFNIDNRELLQRISCGEAVLGIDFGNLIVRELAAFRLAAMDSEPVEMPLDYLQGHKDGLEWAARLAEANHPDTGDWLYDDPIELAKAIRKGPDMPPVQPAPVVSAELLHTAASAIEDLLTTKDRTGACVWFDLPFRLRSAANAQPAPVVPNGLRLALSNAGIAAPESDEMLAATCEKHIQALVTWVKDRKSFQSAPVVPSFEEWISAANQKPLGRVKDAMRESYDACRAAMLAAAPQPQNAPQNIPDIIPNELIAAVNRLLDSNGSRGCYSAIKCYDAHIEVERLLAAARQEVKP